MTDSPISTTREGDILVVTSNNPPVNALGAAVRTGLSAALDEALRRCSRILPSCGRPI